MGRTALFLVGLLMLAVAAGAMWYRISEDPNAARRYDWALEQIGVREKSAAPVEGAQDRSAERSLRSTDRPAELAEREDTQQYTEMLKLGLDVANLLIGLIGIYLAVSGMRGRGTSQNQG